MNPGEYPQPLARIAPLNFTAVGGYTTLRLRNLSVTTLAPEAAKSTIIYQNTGEETVVLQLVETPSIISGPRTNVGAAITVVPSGFKSLSFTPAKSILEVSCTSGTSTVRAQLESLLNWECMASVDMREDGSANALFPPSFNASFGHLPWSSLGT